MLDLDHRALARLVGAVRRLGDDAVEPGALEPRQPVGRPASRSRVIGVRWTGGCDVREQPLEARAPLALRPSAQVRAVGGEQVEGDERRRRLAAPASRRATPPGAAAAAARRSRGPRGVAITISPSTTQPSGRLAEQRVVQLGEVAIERPQVAALDEELGRRRGRRWRGSRPTWARRGTSPSGSASASLASIGSIGGSIGNGTQTIRPGKMTVSA